MISSDSFDSLDSGCMSFPSASTHRPPPPGPPGTYLRRLGGGPESALGLDGVMRGRAGVRVGRRAELGGAAMFSVDISVRSEGARCARVACRCVGSGEGGDRAGSALRNGFAAAHRVCCVLWLHQRREKRVNAWYCRSSVVVRCERGSRACRSL